MQHLIQLNEDTYVDANEITCILCHKAILGRLGKAYDINDDKLAAVLDALVYKPPKTFGWHNYAPTDPTDIHFKTIYGDPNVKGL